MNGLGFVVIGVVLVAWLALLAVILFQRDGKLPGIVNNTDVLLPVGVTLAVWMWIFGFVVLNT